MARLSPKTPEEEEGFSHGFHGLPLPKERDAMSVLELAELLSSKKSGTPAYIVLEHELNMKIAKIQSKATLSAGWMGVVGALASALVTAYFGYLLSTRQPVEAQKAPENKQATSATQDMADKEESDPKNITANITTTSPPLVKPDTKEAGKKTDSEKE